MINNIEINTEDRGQNWFEGEVTIHGKDLLVSGVCEVSHVKEHAGSYDTGFGEQFAPYTEVEVNIRVNDSEYLYSDELVPIGLMIEIENNLNKAN